MLGIETPLLKRAAEDDIAAQPKVKKRLFGRSLQEDIGIDTSNFATKPSTKDDDAERSTPPLEQISYNDLTRSEASAPPGTSTEVDANARLDSVELQESPLEAPMQARSLAAASETCGGKRYHIYERKQYTPQSYERLIAERSTTEAGKATKSFYGIDIHSLIEEAKAISENPRSEATPHVPDVAPEAGPKPGSKKKHAMWTEKYRARRFIDLVGDERIHRSVLKWLKGWDPIVFPGASKPKARQWDQNEEERPHRKILLLTGPPGLGKTTLAHVCARQAGYEAVEINASDERSRDVVKGRIRDCVGTENVRGSSSQVGGKTVRQAGKPVCVVVDEVDGVTSGSGGSGEGGFMKALIDLIQLDQRNAQSSAGASRKGKKADNFRLLRPIILICNDVYHPSLRPLRTSNLAEIIHIRKPPLDKVVDRLKTVFIKEGVQADNDAVRRLCEATWGVSSRKDDQGSKAGGEGDIRSILVTAEWATSKLRASHTTNDTPRLTRIWLDKNILNDIAAGGGPRGAGRGSARETAERVFLENAGFSRSTVASARSSKTALGSDSVTDTTRGKALSLLRTAVETNGETDRVVTEVFGTYPARQFQDDNFLSKPNAVAEWLHFHDTLSSRVHSGQEWELAPYLSASVLGFHHLFGSGTRSAGAQSKAHDAATADDAATTLFQGPRADFEANEARRQNHSQLQSIHAALTLPLARLFRSPEDLAADFLPYLGCMLAPAVNPVVVGGSGDNRGTASVRRDSEKQMVGRGAQAMCAVGVSFERARVEDGRGTYGGFVYRMDPPIDALSTFETSSSRAAGGPGGPVPARYAVRQVLDQEHKKLVAQQNVAARQARFAAGVSNTEKGGLGLGETQGAQVPPSVLDKENVPPAVSAATATSGELKAAGVKRDFFGRIVPDTGRQRSGSVAGSGKKIGATGKARIWVTFHEGFSNAVKKPIGLKALLDSL